MEIVFATGNANKLAEAQRVLGERFHLVMPSELGFDGELPETHETLYENAVEKALFIWNKFQKNCFADDTGLEVDALGGAPGVHSARYAGEPKSPPDNIRKLLKELEGVPAEKRTARFRCVVALIEEGVLHTFEGICEGHITTTLHGFDGFGYDPIFRPLGMNAAMAEISLEEKNSLSHRGKAMEKLLCHLSANPRR